MPYSIRGQGRLPKLLRGEMKLFTEEGKQSTKVKVRSSSSGGGGGGDGGGGGAAAAAGGGGGRVVGGGG